MKILSIIITAPDYSASGAVTAAKNLSFATSEYCEMCLAIMGKNDFEEKIGKLRIKTFKSINRIPLPLNILPNQIKNSFWTSGIDKFIADYQPDLVHFHNPVPPLELWRLAQVCLKHKIPYAISSHGFVEMFDFKQAYNIGLLKGLALNKIVLNPFHNTLRNANATFLLSPHEKAVFRKNSTSKSKVFIVTNGFDKVFENKLTKKTINSCRQKFDVLGKKTTLFFMGNHTRNKGIDILLNSLRFLNDDFHIIIGGRIRSRKDHKALIDSCDLRDNEDRFTFTDFLSNEEAIALYKLCDGFIFPTRADTLPLVILEAMISELPIISTRVGGIPYQLPDDCGILINPGSPDELALAIKTFLNNKSNMKKMGKNAKMRVKEVFNWETSAKKAFDAYTEIIKEQ